MDAAPIEPPDDSAPLLARRPYTTFLVGRFCGTLASTAQGAIIGWEVYSLARESLAGMDIDPAEAEKRASFLLGMVGLCEFLPLIVLTLFAGELADRHNRRVILAVCFLAQMQVSLCFATRVWLGGGLWVVFALAFAFGCARAFFQPAASSLGPMLVPPRLLPRAVAANSLVFQLASIIGPGLGGLLCTLPPGVGYLVCSGLYVGAIVCMASVKADTTPTVEPGRSRLEQVKEGLGYVWGNKLVLGAISLDLFAVLLGGATALLPVYARDILTVGPLGYGAMQAAPAVGALVVAGYLAVRPVRSRAGMTMLLSVVLYGLATVVFAVSTTLAVSLAALFALGGADMVSMFIRGNLVLVATPDRLRGRVSAVSTLFVGASNELGEFESGVAARALGPVGAVVFGGCGAVLVTAVWAGLFPALRKADKLT